MEEEVEEKTPTLEELSAQRTAFSALLKTQGWGLLRNVLELQIAARTREIIYTPCSTEVQQFEQEFRKGECQGMVTAIHIAETLLEDLDVQIEEIKKRMPLEQEDEES